jgi:hypothetical protein
LRKTFDSNGRKGLTKVYNVYLIIRLIKFSFIYIIKEKWTLCNMVIPTQMTLAETFNMFEWSLKPQFFLF